MGDAEDERGVDERMLVLTNGLVALQLAVLSVGHGACQGRLALFHRAHIRQSILCARAQLVLTTIQSWGSASTRVEHVARH